jgi:hypothetical protein
VDRYKHTKRKDLIKEIVALQQELNQVKLHDAGLEQDVELFFVGALFTYISLLLSYIN